LIEVYLSECDLSDPGREVCVLCLKGLLTSSAYDLRLEDFYYYSSGLSIYYFKLLVFYVAILPVEACKKTGMPTSS
jgi:hypothetical protein